MAPFMRVGPKLKNHEWILKSRPGAAGMSASLFEMKECEMPKELADGEALFVTHLISLDPTMRNCMAGPEAAERTAGSAYFAAMNWIPGEVIAWFVIAKVQESKCKELAEGDFVVGQGPLRRYWSGAPAGWEKLPAGVSPVAAMASLGVASQTGFLGAKYIGLPKSGETVFVSSAAGCTGLVACQTFKALGCTVVGSAGADDKVELLKGLGVQAFNYKKESYLAGLQRLCPDGINIAFDNVGGDCLEAMLEMINERGRIVLCGAMSQYDASPDKRFGIKNLFHAIAKQVRLEGFIVFGFTPEQNEDAKKTLTKWLQDGTIKDTSTIIEGFEAFPEALMGLFAGKNTGKMMVQIELDD